MVDEVDERDPNYCESLVYSAVNNVELLDTVVQFSSVDCAWYSIAADKVFYWSICIIAVVGAWVELAIVGVDIRMDWVSKPGFILMTAYNKLLKPILQEWV